MAEIEDYYLRTFFRPQAAIEAALARQRTGDARPLQRFGQATEDDL